MEGEIVASRGIRNELRGAEQLRTKENHRRRPRCKFVFLGKRDVGLSSSTGQRLSGRQEVGMPYKITGGQVE